MKRTRFINRFCEKKKILVRRVNLKILRLEYLSFELGLSLLEEGGQVNMPLLDMMIH